jgi:hypothetical protein
MKQKKFLEKAISTDCNVAMSVSSTTTRTVTAGGRETKGKSGAAITLRDVDGKELTALMTEEQLADFIEKLKELGRFIVTRNHPAPF